jgi:hypothetical protein
MATTMRSLETQPVPDSGPAYEEMQKKRFMAGIVALLVIMVIFGLLTWLARLGTFGEPMDFDCWMIP